jgi:TolB-like protein/Flp pilus assembly protein TadD
MQGSSAQLALSLLGGFALTTADGERVEITSKKGAAIVAVLAMTRGGERSRRWLQEQLWGTRGHVEAAGSLRRELSNLRKQLNTGAEPVLICDRERIRLRLELIDVDAITRPPQNLTAGEFLEGFDLPLEQGFRDWLREQRDAQSRGAGINHAGALPAQVVDVSLPPAGFDANHAIAVLPFVNATDNASLGYLAEGISEELIAGLSRIRWLPVIARSTSFSFVSNPDPKVIGRQLGAEFLVEGRLHRVDADFAVFASLSQTSTGYTIWSRRFTLQFPASQGELEQFVQELVAQLESRVQHAQQTRIRGKPHGSLGVNELIWRGRWHFNRQKRADNEIAARLFAEALALDPSSPEALIQMTATLAWSIWAGRQPRDQIVRMRTLAQQAIVADSEDGRGFLLAGVAEMWLRHPLEAKTLLQQAIALNPSLALAHAQLGGSFNLAGRPEQAIVHLKTALRLSCNDPNMFYSLSELAVAYNLLGRWQDAIEHAQLALARQPTYWYANVIKINALTRSGELDAARVALDELLSLKPRFSRRYIEWLPFADRGWIDHFVDGLRRVPGVAPDWLQREQADDKHDQMR